MQPTQTRKACGTTMGLLLHQDLDEDACGTCKQRERARLVEAERITLPPESWVPESAFRDEPADVARRQALLNSTAYTIETRHLRAVS